MRVTHYAFATAAMLSTLSHAAPLNLGASGSACGSLEPINVSPPRLCARSHSAHMFVVDSSDLMWALGP